MIYVFKCHNCNTTRETDKKDPEPCTFCQSVPELVESIGGKYLVESNNKGAE